MLASLVRRAAAPSLAAPVLRQSLPSLAVRALRTSVPAHSSTAPTVTTSSGVVVPVDKYFDDESLVAHQARVRHADPNNRTFNYTMVGGSRFLGASAARLLAITRSVSFSHCAREVTLLMFTMRFTFSSTSVSCARRRFMMSMGHGALAMVADGNRGLLRWSDRSARNDSAASRCMRFFFPRL